ncbi:MAG: hypothetical protein AAGK78_11715, partial [Planctomycetota bacterium]
MQWLSTFGIESNAPIPPLGEPDETEANTVADALLALIPETNFIGPDFDWRWSERLPLLAVVLDGQETFACPVLPTAEFGDSCVDTIEPLRDEPQIDDVEVSLEAMSSLEIGRRFELVSHRWSGADIAGRQLVISCAPAVSVAERLRSSFHQTPLYIPVLAFQSNTDDGAEERSAVGRPFTVNGTRLDVRDDGAVVVDDTPLTGDGRPATGDAADVAALQIELDAGRFDAITVSATPTNADGMLIEGLTAEAFRLSEDGRDIPFLLTRNRADPRIVIIIDQSLSMPAIWRGDEQVDAFVDALRTTVQAEFPGAQILLDTVGNSDVWGNLAKTTHRNPTATVYVTDGDISDQRSPEIEAALRSSPPALLVYVEEGGTPRSELNEMATLTGGAVLLSAQPTDAANRVLDFVREQAVAPYALSYRAPREGASQRRVELR